ncbi:hypothetical protein OB919_05700 [Halobacteria archaeon AArc-curdl1]|uniref:Uncharacterized protein n=1 Tax=Natronosalvus hydrolyticus TaxID=2979988 RepID=A0AAP2Z6G2_9EURY|nr:hypothetical protein [Halobacteria archaeon AArc-curdl1]
MDYKDTVVASLAFLTGMFGAAVAGGIGLVAGLFVGAGFGATWAHKTDRRTRKKTTAPNQRREE